MSQFIAEVQFIGPAGEDGQAPCSAWRSAPQCPVCLRGMARPQNRYAVVMTCEHCGSVLSVRVVKVDCDDELIRIRSGVQCQPVNVAREESHGEPEQG